VHTSPIINAQGIVDPNIVFEDDITFAVVDPNNDSFFAQTSYDETNMQCTFANGVTRYLDMINIATLPPYILNY
jgi:hypothetical protein